MKNKIKYLLASFASLVVLTLVTAANANVSPPDFPVCSSQSEDGDKAHYDFGLHQILGAGLVEGSDDVYSLGDGNYLQCYCPVEGDDGLPAQSGIQTAWWRIGELTQEEIDKFIGEDWILVNGLQWNLDDALYLGKNSDHSCAEPTPTPTNTLTPTPTVTPTPTPGDEPESRCSSISASPTEGTAPLTVKFNGSGFDEDGDIKKYRFDFGDSSGGQPQVWEQEESEAWHRYENDGSYTASLHVQDSRGNWRNGQADCRIEIEVNGKPRVLAATVTSLPKTGAPLGIVFGLSTLSGLGAYLYKRFKLVN